MAGKSKRKSVDSTVKPANGSKASKNVEFKESDQHNGRLGFVILCFNSFSLNFDYLFDYVTSVRKYLARKYVIDLCLFIRMCNAEVN